MVVGRLENGNAFSEWEMGAARNRGFKAEIGVLCMYERGSADLLGVFLGVQGCLGPG
jgi:hypothetical protein